MKQAVYILGTISVIVLALGVLFKMHHWEGAVIILMTGILLSIISLPVTAVYFAKANLKHKNTYIYWAISTFIMIVGIFFKVQHYPGSMILQIIGTSLFIIFTIFLALKLYKSEVRINL
jgi:hypothetical protein